MKKELLITVSFCFLLQCLTAQVQKVETYLTGTKVTYYPNQCGNEISEAEGKISFCDSQDNLGIVEASYGLNYRAIKKMVPNYFNTDEVFITDAGISIRKANGTWENIPNFVVPRSSIGGNAANVSEAIVNSDGFLFFSHGNNFGLHYFDLSTKTFHVISYATSGISNSNYTNSFTYDSTSNITYIKAVSGGNYKVLKYEANTLTYLGNLPVEVTGENSASQLVFANDALYIGTTTGLYKLNKTTLAFESSYFTDTSTFIVNVQDIAEDTAGNLWLANRNNSDAAIYKFNMTTEEIATFQLARTATDNYDFNNLDIDTNGKVWATANNLSGFVEMEPNESNPIWTLRSLNDMNALGLNMTYSPSEVFKFNDKIYIMTTSNTSSSADVNFEAIIYDNGAWSGISDDEPSNISDKMLNRYYFAYPDQDGVWWYNYFDGGILSNVSNTDKFTKQYNLGSTQSFLLDFDGNPVINGSKMKKINFPYVSNLPEIGTNAITQFHRYKDQIWVFSNSTRKIFVYKYNKLIQTFNLDETAYNTFYDFTPDTNGNAYFAKYVSGEFLFKKFNTITQTTTTYTSTSNLGSIKELIPLPNGNVTVICGGGIFLFDGTTLSVIGSNMYSDLSNIVAGVSDINGKIWLLTNDSAKLIGIENPDSATPTFSTIQVEGTSGLVPYNSFYRPHTFAIDANGAFWSHASKKWFKITTDNTAPQFLNEGITYGITGAVYLDINENNIFDANEAYANQKITLKTSTEEIFETYTNVDGHYYFPYFEGLGAYDLRLPVLSPYVVASERQRLFSVVNLNANTEVSTIQLKPINIESLLVKSSSKLGAWAFTRTNFDNTFTTAIGNISTSKTFNNVAFDYVFFNKEEGSNNTLPDIQELVVTKLSPLTPFHIIDKLTIEPKGHKWKTNVDESSYEATLLSLVPTITAALDTTKVSFTLPTIGPLETYVIEVKTGLFTSSNNVNVISHGVSKASSEDFGDGISGQTVVFIPLSPNSPEGFPEQGGPYMPPNSPYSEPPYSPRGDIYSDPPYETPIRGSYDPNDKLVNPGVPDQLNEVALDKKWFTYIVRFQNEGNFSAKDVFVVDSLDTKFDKYSLTLLESSHPLTVENIISDDKSIIKFNFKDIYLDYTANNELASQGYLKYVIKAKEDVVVSDIMENRAAIYFDQNDPIITNLTQNQFVEPTLFVGSNTFGEKTVEFWPNPVDHQIHFKTNNSGEFHVSIYNLLGQKVQYKTNVFGNSSLNVSALKSGIYLLTVTSDNGNTQTVKFIKN